MGQESSQPEISVSNGVANGVDLKHESEEEEHLEVEERGSAGEGSVRSGGNQSKKASRLPRAKEKKNKKRKSTRKTDTAGWDSLEMTVPEPLILKSQAVAQASPSSSSFKPVNLEKGYDLVPVNVRKARTEEIQNRGEDYSEAADIKEALPAQLKGLVTDDDTPIQSNGRLESGQELAIDEGTVYIPPKIYASIEGDVKPKRKTVRAVKPRYPDLEARVTNEHPAVKDEEISTRTQEQALEDLDVVDMPQTSREALAHKSRKSQEEPKSSVGANAHLVDLQTAQATFRDLNVGHKAVGLAGDNKSKSPPEVQLTIRGVKSKRPRRSGSNIEAEAEPAFQPELAPQETGEEAGASLQLPTPGASRRRLALKTQLSETALAALFRLDKSLPSQESQLSTVPIDIVPLQPSKKSEPVETSQQEPQIKQKRKGRNSTGEGTKGVSKKKRKRSNNEADMESLSGEGQWDMLNSATSEIPTDYEVNRFSSPKPAWVLEGGLISNLHDEQKPPELLVNDLPKVQTHPSLIVDDEAQPFPSVDDNDDHLLSQLDQDIQSLSSVIDEGLPLQLDAEPAAPAPLASQTRQKVTSDSLKPPRSRGNVDRSAATSPSSSLDHIKPNDSTPIGDYVPRSITTKIRDSMRYAVSPPPTFTTRDEADGQVSAQNLAEPSTKSSSWSVVNPDQDTEEQVVPMIGIYQNVNGVFRRKETSSADPPYSSGKENNGIFGAIDVMGDQAIEPPKSGRKKRRAPTENDSLFDYYVVEEQRKRKKKRTSLQPKAPLAFTPFTPKPSRPSSSVKSATAKKALGGVESVLKHAHALPNTPPSAPANPATSQSAQAEVPGALSEAASNYDPSSPEFATYDLETPEPHRSSPSQTKTAKLKSTMRSSTGITSKRSGERKAKEVKEPAVQGKFSDKEIADIANEMVKYREAHDDMPEVELNQLVQDSATTGADLWDQLCDILPGRRRQAIIKICRRKYHNFGARGKWTAEEDDELNEVYNTYPKSWKRIGILLNRHPEDCRDRWRNYLICGDNQKKDVWTEDEEEALKLAIIECLDAIKEIREQEVLNGASNNNSSNNDMNLIDWQMVSVKLNHTRSRLQCMTKWKNVKERENADSGEAKDLELGETSWRVREAKKAVRDMGSEEKLELLHAIRQSGVGREGKVPFKSLGSDEFKEKWSCMARKVAWKKMRATVPGNGDMKLQDIVTILVDEITENPNYATHIQDDSDKQSRSAKRVKMVSSPKAIKRFLSDARIASEDEHEDDQQQELDDSSEESRIVLNEKNKGKMFATGKARRSCPTPALSDNDSVRQLSLENIYSTIREMSAEGEEEVAEESDSPSIPESPVHSHPRSSFRDRYERRHAPFSPDNVRSKDLKKSYEVRDSSNEDDDGDIPARRPIMPSRSESMEL